MIIHPLQQTSYYRQSSPMRFFIIQYTHTLHRYILHLYHYIIRACVHYYNRCVIYEYIIAMFYWYFFPIPRVPTFIILYYIIQYQCDERVWPLLLPYTYINLSVYSVRSRACVCWCACASPTFDIIIILQPPPPLRNII